MFVMTKWFGVTLSDNERSLAWERSAIDEIVAQVLLLQKNTAAKQQRSLCRGTHAKGVCTRAQFVVLDVRVGHDKPLAARLAKGVFANPGVYPAIVRFANSDSQINSDFKPDVRALSFSVDLTRGGKLPASDSSGRQDFALQNATTLPINDARAFLATTKVVTAKNQLSGLLSLPFKDKLRVVRTILQAQVQSRRTVRPYQQLRYWSTVPFRHGPFDFVKQSLTPSATNPARPLQRTNPNGLADEISRHLREDSKMSSFDFGLQFLEVERMTYWGRSWDTDFWIENASVEWKEEQTPFHTVGRLTLLANSQLPRELAEAEYIDVTENATPDSTPVGSMNRVRWHGEIASRKARLRKIAVANNRRVA